MFDTKLDRAGVKAKFDVLPEQIVDYLALVGDSSDNIPGVPKVGPKTAAKWLNEYGSADGIVAHAKDIAGKVGESLRENLATLELSRKLATIRRDLELPLAPADLHAQAARRRRAAALYKRLELNSLLRQLTGTAAPAPGGRDPASERVSSGGASEPDVPAARAGARSTRRLRRTQQLDHWIAALDRAPLFAFDTETTSLDYMQAEIVGVSFCIEPGKAAYLPLAHDYAGAPDQLDRTKTLAKLKPLLEDAKRPKVGHHLKYDAHVLQVLRHRARRHALRLDARVLRAELDRDAPRHGFLREALPRRRHDQVRGRRRQGREADHRSTRCPSSGPPSTRPRTRTSRCSCTASCTPRSRRSRRCCAIYEEIEQPLVPVLLEMEHRGVLVDRELLKKQSGETREAARRARGRGAQVGRPAVQPRFAEAAAGNPVHASRACRCGRRPAPASPPRPRTCSRNSPRNTRCRASSWSTAASRSCARPTPRSCPSRSTRRPAACTPPITRRSR